MNDLPDNLIHFEDVDFSYNRNPVLENVNLTIKRNELVSVVGPNGGGKTTFLLLILNVIKPTRGKISVFGKEPGAVRSRIGYVPQHLMFDTKFPASVLDVVLTGIADRHIFGLYSKADKTDALDALAEVDVAQLANRPFAGLSGGQRQRVLTARALVTDPELLLLDEPTSNVDSATERKLTEILRKLNKRMTIVLVSHDLGFVMDMVQKVICINKRAVMHPTSQITGEVIQDIYGNPVRMVRHDHSCS
ncbi:MAG: ABC transporter ATP-binding protein [Lentisphaerae bacterium]|nr:ABC transporter ATP-binding protein [Lentisphaerota bacterium]